MQYHLRSLSPDPMTIVDFVAISSANIVVICVQKCHYDHTSGVDDSVANGSNEVCKKFPLSSWLGVDLETLIGWKRS